MIISNLINKQGNAVKNQFIITEDNKITFQSYNSKIVAREGTWITFYPDYNYSITTAKYRNKFLSDMLGVEIKTADVERMIQEKRYHNYNVMLMKWSNIRYKTLKRIGYSNSVKADTISFFIAFLYHDTK